MCFQTLKHSLVEIYSVQPREYRTSPYKLYGVVLAAYIWKVLSKVPTDYDNDPSLGVSGRFLSKYIENSANHISRSFGPQNISRHVLESPEWDLCTDHNSTFVRWNPKKTLLVKNKHTVHVYLNRELNLVTRTWKYIRKYILSSTVSYYFI